MVLNFITKVTALRFCAVPLNVSVCAVRSPLSLCKWCMCVHVCVCFSENSVLISTVFSTRKQGAL